MNDIFAGVRVNYQKSFDSDSELLSIVVWCSRATIRGLTRLGQRTAGAQRGCAEDTWVDGWFFVGEFKENGNFDLVY